MKRNQLPGDEVLPKSVASQPDYDLYLERISIGLSHDINNVFTYILGMAELGKLQDIGVASNGECFDKIISYIDRGKNLTQHVMDFGNSFHCNKESFDFSDFLCNFKSKFEQNYTNGQKINLTISGDVHTVSADKMLLDKLFFYIFKNACEACSDGESFAEAIDCHAYYLNKEELECTISDQGRGLMNDKSVELFEPFYTTKKAIQHAGMGLTIAQQIVLVHGGAIDIFNNTNDNGATVKFKLPILSL